MKEVFEYDICDNIMMDIQKLPYYIFLIVRPDGNTAFSRIHQQYPLELDINQLLTLGSSLNNLNTMQGEIIHPDIKNSRKDEIDLAKNSSIKSINASTFQMRFLDTISGYMFIISSSNSITQTKLDTKLEQIYKIFVDYIIKSPFFNVTIPTIRAPKKQITQLSSRNVTRSYTSHDSVNLFENQ